MTNNQDKILVCGLGSFGQHCVATLKAFGVTVIAIEANPPEHWEIPDFPNLLDELIIGDCRQYDVLEKAKIRQCRAVLLVTSDERVDLEVALAARLLNPQIRLVVRSTKENLNELLGQELGNYVAYEPTELPAPAFALVALGNETLGLFNLESQWLRVVQLQIQPGNRWCDRPIHELNNRARRVISYTPRTASQPPEPFFQWDCETRLAVGDTLAYIEQVQHLISPARSAADSKRVQQKLFAKLGRLPQETLKEKLIKFWQAINQNQIQRVAIACGITVLILLLLGIILLHRQYPRASLLDTFYTIALMLLGGYEDVIGSLKPDDATPKWLRLFNVGMILAGTAFVGVLYALLTQYLLSLKLQFLNRRPPIPKHDHVVIIGLGRVGKRVAAFLQNFKQPLLGIHFEALDENVLPQVPVLTGNISNLLEKANLAKAKSVIVTTDDELLNLEIGLMARRLNPNSNIVIRIFEQRFSENLARLLPHTQILCAYALAAKAFAGSAFGENIEHLFRLDNHTILVTEYTVKAGDTLDGLILAEVAYGYRVVPIFYQKQGEKAEFIPLEDTRLTAGDRLVVLAASKGLQRIERGERGRSRWQIEVEKALSKDAVFDGANEITCLTGWDMGKARSLMQNLPQTLPVPLYRHQAQLLVRRLNRVQVIARLVPIKGEAVD